MEASGGTWSQADWAGLGAAERSLGSQPHLRTAEVEPNEQIPTSGLRDSMYFFMSGSSTALTFDFHKDVIVT